VSLALMVFWYPGEVMTNGYSTRNRKGRTHPTRISVQPPFNSLSRTIDIRTISRRRSDLALKGY
ncbi:MAG: hypothetical protein AB2693_34380, partial [Candidatus Thiodiazotropha sp.]